MFGGENEITLDEQDVITENIGSVVGDDIRQITRCEGSKIEKSWPRHAKVLVGG